MSFSIGQVIYVLSDKSQTVLPGIVREEIHHRSIDGEKVSYRVVIGPQGKQRVIDLATVDGEVYGDLSEIREVLVSRLTAFVDDLCSTTNERVGQWYGGMGKPASPTSNGEKLDPSVLMNEISSNQFVQQPQQKPTGLNGLRSALADPELTAREYVDADGTIRKLNQ
jgi:hypothetical protein